jgi:polar amino acid transport system substrate-binding protein
MRKLTLALLLAFGLIAAACGSDTTVDSAGNSVDCDNPTLETAGTLTVATGEPAFLPWVADDSPESEEGFEAALVYALAAEMGIDNVVWTRTGFDDAISPGAKAYDFNIQQFSITEDREEVVDFSDGYYQVEQAIIGAADGAASSAESVDDLKELNLGAAIGTTSLDYIEETIEPDNKAAVFDDNVAAKSSFDAGQVDAIVFDLPTAYFITAVEIPEAAILGVLPRTGTPEELGMLFEEGSPLVPCVNAALSTLKDNDTIEKLEDEWLNSGGSIPTLSN